MTKEKVFIHNDFLLRLPSLTTLELWNEFDSMREDGFLPDEVYNLVQNGINQKFDLLRYIYHLEGKPGHIEIDGKNDKVIVRDEESIFQPLPSLVFFGELKHRERLMRSAIKNIIGLEEGPKESR